MTEAHVREVLDAAKFYVPPEPIGPEPPRPLAREMPPAPAFPVSALGPILSAATDAIQDRVRAPAAICAQSVLGAAALAAQALADVELPTGQRRPLSCYFVSIAASGERKTSCDWEALAPIREREKSLREAYKAAFPAYLNAKDAFEKQRQQVLTDKTTCPDAESKRRALDALGEAPQPPLHPVLTATEPTLAGLHRMLAEGQPAVGLFSSEGGQFLSGHGMNVDNKILTAAGLSSLWDGETVRRVRAGDGVVVLPGRRVAAHLMMQPDIGAGLMADPILANQGLLSRLLTVAPDTTAGTRWWREPRDEGVLALRRYSSRLLDLLERPLPLAPGARNELEPRRLLLTPAARVAWVRFTDYAERALAPGGAYDPIRAFANKLAQHAARLAGVLAVVDDPEAGEISGEQLALGIELAQHYAAEALRLSEAGRLDPGLCLAQRVLAWLADDWKGALISLPDIYRLGPPAVRDAKSARRVVECLEDHGWLETVAGPVVVNSTSRREAWRIRRP